MGWTDYRSLTTTRYVTFHVYFDNLTTGSGYPYGINMQPPVPIGFPVNRPVRDIGISLFSMKFLTCWNTPYYYLDVINNICI